MGLICSAQRVSCLYWTETTSLDHHSLPLGKLIIWIDILFGSLKMACIGGLMSTGTFEWHRSLNTQATKELVFNFLIQAKLRRWIKKPLLAKGDAVGNPGHFRLAILIEAMMLFEVDVARCRYKLLIVNLALAVGCSISGFSNLLSYTSGYSHYCRQLVITPITWRFTPLSWHC